MPPVIGVMTIANASLAQEIDEASGPEAVVYKTTAEGIEISADVYHADATVGPRPVIVWYHGGALMFGSRSGVPRQLLDLSRKENLVLVSMDYRLAPGARIDQIIADVKDGLDWVRKVGPEKFGIDPARLLVAGASAGGYLAMMSGIVLDPPPKALVSYWGFGDIDGAWCNTPNKNYGRHLASTSEEELWKAVGDEVLTNTTKKTGAAQANLFLFLKRNGGWGKMVSGFDPESGREKMAPYCPIQHLTAAYPPILLLHGTEDNDVPYECSTDMVEALKKVGVSHELITVKGGGHSLWGGDRKVIEAAFQRSLDYIRHQLSTSAK